MAVVAAVDGGSVGYVVAVAAVGPGMLDQIEATEQRETKQRDLVELLPSMVMWTVSERRRLQPKQCGEDETIRPASLQ